MKRNILKHIFPLWLVMPYIALGVYILTRTSTFFPGFIETFYSDGIYPLIASSLSLISSFYPFSLDDAFYVFLIAAIIALFILLFTGKLKLKIFSLILLNSLSAIYISFYILWGFNYYRLPLNQRLGLKSNTPNIEDFTRVVKLLTERTNQSWCSFERFNKKEIDRQVEEGYKEFANALKINYPNGKRRPKTILFSRFFANAGISGYYGPFFNEVHISSLILPIEYPFVLAHEKAHQFGVSNEAEANFYAWLVCSRSNSKQLRYSAYLQILRSFLNESYKINLPPEVLFGLDNKIKDDYKKIQAHWDGLRIEKMDKTASKVYDTYLKTNKVVAGIKDYEGVVKYIMDFSNDPAFRKKLNLP